MLLLSTTFCETNALTITNISAKIAGLLQPLQERCAIARPHAHTCTKAFRSVINHTRKLIFSPNVSTT